MCIRDRLNLGHTFAHALEASGNYSASLLHGEAVAVGMVLAFRLSERMGHASAADTQRLVAHLRRVGLPTTVLEVAEPPPDPDRLLSFMRQDKKARGGNLKFVLARGLGHAFVSSEVPLASVRAVLAD